MRPWQKRRSTICFHLIKSIFPQAGGYSAATGENQIGVREAYCFFKLTRNVKSLL